MGGCRCCFQSCANTTNLAKESATNSHFFHFPIRDPSRCVEWAIYANKMEFLSMPLEKLKNKVICDLHFSENHFMNYHRNKLNKTTAIPTLYIDDNKQEIDLEQNPTDYVTENRKAEIPPQFKVVSISAKSSEVDLKDPVVEYKPPTKKIKTEVIQKPSTSPPQGVRVLNKGHISSNSPSTKTITVNLQKVNQIVHKKLPTTTKIQKIPIKDEVPVVIKPADTVTPTTTSEISMIENGEFADSFEYFTVVTNEEQPQVVVPVKPKPIIPDEFTELLRRTSSEVSDLKRVLNTSLTKMKAEETTSNISQTPFNKVQLFNGIKRYLSPSLMALVRMELFGGPSRDYKQDEKIICAELLKLGEGTYDFFNDEWRLRLPTKEQVKSWENEALDDDDAC